MFLYKEELKYGLGFHDLVQFDLEAGRLEADMDNVKQIEPHLCGVICERYQTQQSVVLQCVGERP